MERQIIFLKLGGSLISCKDQADTAREDLLSALLGQIASYQNSHPESRMILGHGSGSFGHMPARKYGTRDGVFTPSDWAGYQDVWWHARKLNQLVLELGHQHSLPLISFPPSAMVTTRNHIIQAWDTRPIRSALDQNLLPLVYGDVVTDLAIGGTILSTEELFLYLAREFKPSKVFLAGLERGIYADYPANTCLLESVEAHQRLSDKATASGSVDVTGGMRTKLAIAQQICLENPQTEVRVFSATVPEQLRLVLEGAQSGTRIYNDENSEK